MQNEIPLGTKTQGRTILIWAIKQRHSNTLTTTQNTSETAKQRPCDDSNSNTLATTQNTSETT